MQYRIFVWLLVLSNIVWTYSENDTLAQTRPPNSSTEEFNSPSPSTMSSLANDNPIPTATIATTDNNTKSPPDDRQQNKEEEEEEADHLPSASYLTRTVQTNDENQNVRNSVVQHDHHRRYHNHHEHYHELYKNIQLKDTVGHQRQRPNVTDYAAGVAVDAMRTAPIKGVPRGMGFSRPLGNAGGAVFLGYANNPFGPSRMHSGGFFGNHTRNNSYGKAPIFPALKPEPPSAYHLDTGQSTFSHYHSIDSNDVDNYVTDYLGSDDGSVANNLEEQEETRHKRGVLHLYNMVSCATGCNPLSYKGYGCYCGFLGSGYAVDGIDRCCKFHDWCYDTAGCPMYLEYFVPYYWKCHHRRPICAVEHGEWGGTGSCAQRLCECDRVLSECLRKFPCPHTRAICTSSPWRLLQNAFMIL